MCRRIASITADVFLGSTLMARGLYEEAETVPRRGLDFEEPGFGELFFNLAQTLRSLRRYEEAVEYYERALEMDPDYAEVRKPVEDVRRVIADRG